MTPKHAAFLQNQAAAGQRLKVSNFDGDTGETCPDSGLFPVS